MKRFVLPTLVILLLLWSQSVHADSLSLAKQWESRGNYLKAAEEYSMAAAASNNLNRKAELMYEVGRCRLKAGEAAYIGALISDIKTYASDKGAMLVPKLLSQLEELAWRLGDEEARQAFSVILSENPGRRKDLSEKANAKNRKALAYWLNPELNKADCRAKRAKALTAKTTAEVTDQLSATRDICQDTPSEVEHAAFTAKALAESNDLVALSLFEKIKAIWGYLNQPSMDKLLVYGKKIRIIEGNEATVERIRQILPDQLVKDELIRVLEAPEGKWSLLETKGGERCPWLVAPTVVGKVDFQSNGCDYTIVFEDGQRFDMRTPKDIKRFKSVQWIPKFYVVAAPAEMQPKNLSYGMCIVGVEIKSF